MIGIQSKNTYPAYTIGKRTLVVCVWVTKKMVQNKHIYGPYKCDCFGY